MSERIALVGFVNSEEILADTIRRQSPEVIIDGYELFPNEAFGRIVDNRYLLYGTNEAGEFGVHNLGKLGNLATTQYSAINLGPDTAALMVEESLLKYKVQYVGPRVKELELELDKSKIFDIFDSTKEILPPSVIITKNTLNEIPTAIESLGSDVIVKFVGDYSEVYNDSEYRRVRSLNEFESLNELIDFAAKSVDASGKFIVQKKIIGQEFSYTCLVDANGGTFRLGENIFYKRRFNGDRGPLCDGTGSISIANTLPGLVDEKDLAFIEGDILEPYLDFAHKTTGHHPRTFLNLDLIKDKQGKIYLIEVNNRQPGGHTMSTLLGGLKTPIYSALKAAQEDRLKDMVPEYTDQASIAITVFPKIAPIDFTDETQRPTIKVPKNQQGDDVRLYTGWVDVVNEDSESVTVKTNLTATVIAACTGESLLEARHKVYSKIADLTRNVEGFDYRTDIGLIAPSK